MSILLHEVLCISHGIQQGYLLYLAFVKYYLAFVKYYLAFVKYYLAFVKYYLAFVKYYLAFVKYYIAFVKYYLAFVKYYLAFVKYYFSIIKFYRFIKLPLSTDFEVLSALYRLMQTFVLVCFYLLDPWLLYVYQQTTCNKYNFSVQN